MFRRFPTLLILALLVVGLSGATLAQDHDLTAPRPAWDSIFTMPGEQADEGNDDQGFGFGKKIAGSYYVVGSFTVTLPEEDPFTVELEGLQTYGVYGTLVSTDNGSFNPTGGLQSPGHGTWVKTGPLSLTNNALIFAFTPTGELTFTAKPTGEWIFDDESFDTGTTSFVTCIFAPGQNPATEEPAWGCPTVGQATFFRIQKAE